MTRSRLILRIKGPAIETVAFGPRKNIYERATMELGKILKSPDKKTKS